jgi:hypothetical protein
MLATPAKMQRKKMSNFRQLKQLYALCNNTHLMLDGGAVGYYFER